MMELKVERYEEEEVKPVSPTPESLRTYKLCLTDQLSSTFYTPVVFFYAASSPLHDYDRLKLSLSKALSLLYPLAGRQKDEFTVHCNDEGAQFIRANVTNADLAHLLRHPKVHLLRKLFPRAPYPTTFDPSQPILAVQVNRFLCGGTAVAICLWHGLADAAALVSLIRTWAGFNRGEAAAATHDSFAVDPTAIFPPIKFDVQAAMSSFAEMRRKARGNYIGKRHVFSKQEVERIKDELVVSGRRPTRVEAMSAFVWAAVIRANVLANPKLKMHILTNAVELRGRLVPPLPPTCLGNINQLTAARWEAGAGVTALSLMGRVRESIRRMDDGYVRRLHEGGGYLKAAEIIGERMGEGDGDEVRVLSMSSWFKFEFLEMDFGWGKPRWLGPGHSLGDLALLLDAEDGGIELWMGLPKAVAFHLHRDPAFASHVTFTQIVWEPPPLLPTRL
ncbi:unnamed protein product [Cuscuta europaea]|uniref:BAHD acyltransferase n=1 Tax=Cuscuta europaea TaxID=41803 RepID=A0A9P1EGD3_CUSEU|nr:unnamed protein product [Cuscuta europaea]